MPSKAPTKTGKTKTGKAAPKKPVAKRPAAARASTRRAPAKPVAPRKDKPAAPRSRAGRAQARTAPSIPIPRAMPIIDDDDVLMAHGAGGGVGFGRCGGRMLGSQLEQTICDRLGNAGVAHSHSPRHFEVTVHDKLVAAYAPMIVLRGRGREGKSVVIEAADAAGTSILKKVTAFRVQYGPEYYVILVAPEDVLDEVTLSTYDEACAETDLNTLIARLAE